MMGALAKGDPVTPSPALVELRPELAGAAGKVMLLEAEGQVLVRWEGLPKPYRVLTGNLETVQGD